MRLKENGNDEDFKSSKVLHGSRRYVCRGCTSHLRLATREMRTKQETENRKNHTKQQNHTPNCKVAMNSSGALSTSSSGPCLLSTQERQFDFPSAFEICCVLRAMSSGAEAPYFKWGFINQGTVLQGMGCKSAWRAFFSKGKQHNRTRHHASHREYVEPGCRTHAAQGKQLFQQSRTSNHRNHETVEPWCQEVGRCDQAQFWQADIAPPRGRGSGKLAHPRCDGDSKNSFATGVTERQKFQNALREPS